MFLVGYETLPLPEAQGDDTTDVLAKYTELLRYDIPGLMIRKTTLDELADIVVTAGLVEPCSAFDIPELDHEESSFSDDVALLTPGYQPEYHIDDLPVLGARTVLNHHKTTRGAHELTVATFTSRYIKKMQKSMTPKVRIDTTCGISKTLESTMRNGKIRPKLVSPTVYRGRVGTDDVVVIRIMGESPTIHDFHTLPEAGTRGAIIRSYRALALPQAH